MCTGTHVHAHIRAHTHASARTCMKPPINKFFFKYHVFKIRVASHIKVPHQGVPDVILRLTPENPGHEDELASCPCCSWPAHQEDSRDWWKLRFSLSVDMDPQLLYRDIVSSSFKDMLPKQIQAFPDLTQQAWHSIPGLCFGENPSHMAGAESETNVGSRFSHGINCFRRLNVEKSYLWPAAQKREARLGREVRGVSRWLVRVWGPGYRGPSEARAESQGVVCGLNIPEPREQPDSSGPCPCSRSFKA